jgi:hypothetical protein
MTHTDDAATRLEAKLDELIATLDPDELAVLHGAVHLATEGAEVEGFAVSLKPGVTVDEDPCGGGQIFDPGAISLIGNLHTKVHIAQPRPPAG